MKKLSILAILLLVLAPASAMAGMTAASDMDLSEVSGQTGITISMSMTVTATGLAWGDDDGFGTTYNDPGWVVLNTVTLPNISLSGVSVDVGTSTLGTESRLQIDTGADDIISGDLTIESIVIGSGPAATTPSLGELRVTGIGIGFGKILIGGTP